jgi:hypothetical protein
MPLDQTAIVIVGCGRPDATDQPYVHSKTSLETTCVPNRQRLKAHCGRIATADQHGDTFARLGSVSAREQRGNFMHHIIHRIVAE